MMRPRLKIGCPKAETGQWSFTELLVRDISFAVAVKFRDTDNFFSWQL